MRITMFDLRTVHDPGAECGACVGRRPYFAMESILHWCTSRSTPEQPNYAVRVQAFVQATVPEPFRSAFDATGGSDVWGLPTSEPASDPNNPNFVYQRFEHGILFHNATEGTTEPIV